MSLQHTHALPNSLPKRLARAAMGVVAAATVGATAMAGSAVRADAATLPRVYSPSCGTIAYDATSYTGATTLEVDTDSGYLWTHAAKGYQGTGGTGLPGGKYAYQIFNPTLNKYVGGGVVTVAKCAGGRMRTAEGDANGDGRADVFGVSRTGSLIYYRMVTNGLQNVKVVYRSGFATTKYIQRVTEVASGSAIGAKSPNYLFGIRTDGTIWRYRDNGNGNIGTGVKIGSGLTGYSGFAITQYNSPMSLGGHYLLAVKSGKLYAFTGLGGTLSAPRLINSNFTGVTRLFSLKAYDGNGFADLTMTTSNGNMYVNKGSWSGYGSAVQIGHGWSGMQIVASPGDFSGDGLSDMVARRSDGNLYKYLNVGGKWGNAVKIGKNWNGIVCLG